MEVKAELNYVRVSPRKVRLVANMIRGTQVLNARTQLKFLPKKSSGMLLKLLNSAIANAKHNFSLAEGNLYIAKIFVDGGPILKRMRPRAFGRSAGINKRTSHITIVLDEVVPGKEKAKKIKKSAMAKKTKLKNEAGINASDAVAGESVGEEKGKEKYSLQEALRENRKLQSQKPKEFMKKVFRRKVI